MITHYFKVALRNLLKYKAQSAISISGLAVGFVCFALSAYWIHYETTYDHFRRDMERIYMLRTNDGLAEGKISPRVPYCLADYLTEHFPEIEVAAPFYVSQERVRVNGVYYDVPFSSADSAWMQLMDIRIVTGNRNFMLPKDNSEIAITEQQARQWFGTEDPLGKEVKMYRRTKKICAVVRAYDTHTCFPFGLIGNPELGRTWWYINWNMLVKVKPGVKTEELEAKINAALPPELKLVNGRRKTGIERIYLTPLSELHYAKDFLADGKYTPNDTVVFRYIVYFSLSGILIIACALVNYLTLFINRMRVRQREMALRMIHGASIRSLIALLTTEFLLLLVCSVFVGCLLIEICQHSFIELANIDTPKSNLYGEALLFIGAVSLFILSVIIGLLRILYHRSLHRSLRHDTGRRTGSLLRKGSIVIQLFVCFSFIGCTLFINRQLDYLRHYDMGVEFHNRGNFSFVSSDTDKTPFMNKIAALPMVTEVLPPDYYSLLSPCSIGQWSNWEGLDTPLDVPIPVNLFLATEEFFRFYGITLLAGEWINELSPYEDIIINESLARRMGWTPHEAIGKHILSYITYTVKGVVKDCHYASPTLPVPPTGFVNGDEMQMMGWMAGILFKYKEGTWNECRQALEEIALADCPPDRKIDIHNEEEMYGRYLRSEDMLSRLLGFASFVCVLTALFGIYSLVTLTCEQRRKEIAIRKVNGAKVYDILALFFREYMGMLCLSALLAFPVTYAIIKHWTESYVRQCPISPLPFIGMFISMALVVAFGIGWRVWRAANENPAEVIKNE